MITNKIYSNKFLLITCFVFLLLSYFLNFENVFLKYSLICFCSVCFSFSILTYFIPFYIYDEGGIRVKFGKIVFINYNWDDVKRIYSFHTLASYITVVEMKDNGLVLMAPYFTRSYFEVASKIIECVRGKNKNVKIDKLTLDKIKKREIWTRI